ncbi:hypothetical protein M0D21_13095 [Aquimarina sp. D1M17]|uniref:hypothetical protein n=1 Tax=Aquimarina acroporae TaxID=2937283 RepID=UPI0020BEE6A6|nr:hypothetical protein [Aquimarina acroporae]MCK8522514.1 hypothetical protein [Aquimarina acroporae]
MIDQSNKYKDLIQIPEDESIPFDMHYICVSEKKTSNLEEKFVYMKKYRALGSITDFYKKNSNIIDIDS